MLDFGRVDAGAARYKFEPVDPRSMIDDVVDRFKNCPGARGHPVMCHANGALPVIAVDREAFALALNNLLENAAAGREIRLRRVTQPTPEQQRLLDQLDLPIPTHLEWSAECSGDFRAS